MWFWASNLLEKASQLDDSIERLVWVSVFTCATYHGSPHRDAKPFNPLLGETYEWQDGRLRFIAEQVVMGDPYVLIFLKYLSCISIHDKTICTLTENFAGEPSPSYNGLPLWQCGERLLLIWRSRDQEQILGKECWGDTFWLISAYTCMHMCLLNVFMSDLSFYFFSLEETNWCF